jgi:hypothetical protein
MASLVPDTKHCDNLACLCEVPLKQATCSEACAAPEARDPANIRCGCGHDVCTEQVEAQLHGAPGRESLV